MDQEKIVKNLATHVTKYLKSVDFLIKFINQNIDKY